jgi:hypothetical protein
MEFMISGGLDVGVFGCSGISEFRWFRFRGFTCSRCAADAYHNEMHEQGPFSAPAGSTAVFGGIKGGCLGGYWCVSIKIVFFGLGC